MLTAILTATRTSTGAEADAGRVANRLFPPASPSFSGAGDGDLVDGVAVAVGMQATVRTAAARVVHLGIGLRSTRGSTGSPPWADDIDQVDRYAWPVCPAPGQPAAALRHGPTCPCRGVLAVDLGGALITAHRDGGPG